MPNDLAAALAALAPSIAAFALAASALTVTTSKL